MRARLGRVVAFLERELSVRTVQFYGGVALIGFGSVRLAIAGAVLVVHAVIGPLLMRRGG